MNFFNKFNKLNNKLEYKTNITKVIIIGVFALLLTITGSSYAYLTYVDSAPLVNSIAAGNLEITLSNESGILTLSNAIPQSDEDGLSNSTYNFTITNTGEYLTHYEVDLNSVCSTSNTYTVGADSITPDVCLNSSFVKVGLKINDGDWIIEKFDNDVAIIDAGEIEANASINYQVTLWIDEGTPNTYSGANDQNVLFVGQLSVSGKQMPQKQTLYKLVASSLNTTITPNYNYISNYNTNNINTNDNGVFLYNGTDDNGGNRKIYYYRGNVTNNNVLFGGFCWKIVRTTSTGGTKLIYNGTPKTEYTNLEKLEQSDYLNLTNSSSYPYTFDTSTNKWTSGSVPTSGSAPLSFTVEGDDDYILEYDVSTEGNNDIVYIYKDDVVIKTLSGIDTGQVDLGTLTSSNVIKIKYSKNNAITVGRDNIIFSLNKKSNTSTSYTTCDNSGEDSQIAKTAYNTNYTSPSDVGYMYGERYAYTSKTMTSITDTLYYGNDVTYSNGIYTLTDTITSIGSNWSSGRFDIADGHYYTCFSTGTTCSEVYYITYLNNKTTAYYLTLTNGDTIDTAKTKMYTNTNDSTIKTVLDNWYNTNLSSYSSYLENTIFCNERTIYQGPLYDSDIYSLITTGYQSMTNLPSTPTLTCLNNNDKFSLSTSSGGTSNYGNNALTYPIGLITADEMSIAGASKSETNTNFYLYNGVNQTTFSPFNYDGAYSYSYNLSSLGKLNYEHVGNEYGARGVISLKYKTVIISGDGSYTNPYVVG